jgi:hypothetical protein
MATTMHTIMANPVISKFRLMTLKATLWFTTWCIRLPHDKILAFLKILTHGYCLNPGNKVEPDMINRILKTPAPDKDFIKM